VNLIKSSIGNFGYVKMLLNPETKKTKIIEGDASDKDLKIAI
jgi:hypothetical protein